MTGPGRPFSPDPASNVTSVRLTDSEHELAKEAADLTGMRLGAYMRVKVVAAAKRDLKAAARRQEPTPGSKELEPATEPRKRPAKTATATDRAAKQKK